MLHSNDKYIISEFHGFEVDKKLIKEAIETNSTISISCILQKANTLNRNGRVYPFKILKREVDKYMELVRERSAMGECVPAVPQIYTHSGWKNIENVVIGDKVFTLNVESNKLEFQEVFNTIKKKYNDDLIHIYNSHIDMVITKKHKVVLWNRQNKPYILTGAELFEKIKNNDSVVNHSYIKNSGVWDGDLAEFVQIHGLPKIKTEDWAAFLGVFIAEGHCSGTKGSSVKNIVTITQVKPDSKQKIKNLLDKLPFEYHVANDRQFIINNEFLYNHLRPLGYSFEKHIPEYAKNWAPTLLNILLDWLLMGDGKNRKDRNNKLIKEYFTISNKLTEDVSEIMLKLGYGVSTSKIIPKDRFIYDIKEIEKEVELNDGTLELVTEKIKIQRLIKSENSNELHLVHAKTTKGVYLDSRYTKCELIPFNDFVYCVSVTNKTWLMKSDNKISWTHNCDHPDSAVISLANVSHLVTEMWWEGETLYGKVEIADTPSGNIVKGLLKSGIKLGISSRGVGSVKSSNDKDVVQEDFELIAFDIVSSPSTPGAYLFKEGRQWGMKKLTSEDMKNVKVDDFKSMHKDAYKKIIDLSEENFWKNK